MSPFTTRGADSRRWIVLSTVVATVFASWLSAGPSWAVEFEARDVSLGVGHESDVAGCLASGDFDGDGRADVVAVADGVPVVLYGVGTYQAPVELDASLSSVHDVAVVVEAGVDDRVVTAGGGGVRLWTLGPDGVFTSEVVSATPATACVVVEVSGGLRVAFLTDADELRTKALDATGTETVTLLPSSGHELVSLVWLPGTDEQVAVRCDGSLEVHDALGTWEGSWAATDIVAVTTSRDYGALYDRLVWVTSPAVGPEVVHTASMFVSQASAALPFTGSVRGVAVVDIDGDGVADLVATLDDCSVEIVLGDSGVSPPFAASVQYSLDAIPELECSGDARPLCRDLDQDGVVDIATPQGPGVVRVTQNHVVPGRLEPDVDDCVTIRSGHLEFDVIATTTDDVADIAVFRSPYDLQGIGLPDGESWYTGTEALDQMATTLSVDLGDDSTSYAYWLVVRTLDASGIPGPDVLRRFVPLSGGVCPQVSPGFGRLHEGLDPIDIIDFDDLLAPPGTGQP